MAITDILHIVFLLVTVGLLLFYLFTWRRMAKHMPSNDKFSKLPFVSVIICAKNEQNNLSQFLEFVLSQKYPDFEVLVVDDNSTDDSLTVLKEFKKKYSQLKVLTLQAEKSSFGKKQVLEFGIEHAKSDYLVMTDADCKPLSASWLVGIVNGFADGSELVLGVSLYSKLKGTVNSIIQNDTGFIAANYLSMAASGFPYMSVGRNVAYKRSLFEKVGGFKSHYHIPSGDDDLLINQMPKKTKVNLIYNKGSQTESVPKLSFKSYFSQKIRHVSAGMKYNKRNLLILSLYYSFTTLWYLLIPSLIYCSDELLLISTFIIVKKVAMYSFIQRIFLKIGVRSILIKTIFSDILSIGIHNYAVIRTIFKSKVGKW